MKNLHMRFWMSELPLRWRSLLFRLNPYARARQYRTERDRYKRWLNDCESR